jgi:hydrophobe/amphiphile efflux-1 (HAE1) family protein
LSYPGASPKTINDSVVSLIERQISGVKDVLYFSASSSASGEASITVTFKKGTDVKLAQVEIQNQIKAIESRLPIAVRQAGITVESSSSSTLMYVGLISPTGEFTEPELNDYMIRHVIEELKRVSGVGRIQMFGAEFAMRVWLDPIKLNGFNLSMADVTQAIQEQNIQIAPGKVGDSPIITGQQTLIPLSAQGQLETPEEFKNIVLRSVTNGGKVLLSDVANVELGSQNYNFTNRANGQAATFAAIKLSPGANAISASDGIHAKLEALQTAMPAGIEYTINSDAAPFAKTSIKKVLITLVEAMLLVFVVMYLFLQKFSYTIIPAIVAPIALLGTLSVMMLFGFSINVFTMFGMVLAIGIIVDDAIVVVENVERIMAETGLAAKEATQQAMKETTNAIVGITAVMSAVFIPMAFATGSVGTIYQQFTLSMAVSILFSALLAFSLTPALCATILKPVTKKHHQATGFFGWFNKSFDKLTQQYQKLVGYSVSRAIRMMVIYIVMLVITFVLFGQLSTTFLPEEDQGYILTSIQLPSDATTERTEKIVKGLEDFVLARDAIDSSMTVLGFSFSGTGAGSAFSVTTLKDWDERAGSSTQAELQALNEYLGNAEEGAIFSMLPPAVEGLGNSSNLSFQLLDRGNSGYDNFQKSQAKFIELANQSELLANVFFETVSEAAGVKLEINRQKAQALGVSFTGISDTLSTAMGSTYVNDFPNKGRLQQVIVQAKASARMQVDDILKLTMLNDKGGIVYLSELVTPVWQKTPLQLARFNGAASVAVSASPAKGISSGNAMLEIEKIVAELPKGITIEWTGLSRQEKVAESQTGLLLAFSMLLVFLILAALYESWSIPLSVILVVPLGIIGAIVALLITGMQNDVFFKVGLITIIGLSAKNAILIIEFAQIQRSLGQSLIDAVIHAAKLRMRPIIMTSLAFTCGIIPLVIASGPSSEIQNSLGTGVLGGMISGTVLALLFVPIFFVFVNQVIEKLKKSVFSRKATAE